MASASLNPVQSRHVRYIVPLEGLSVEQSIGIVIRYIIKRREEQSVPGTVELSVYSTVVYDSIVSKLKTLYPTILFKQFDFNL